MKSISRASQAGALRASTVRVWMAAVLAAGLSFGLSSPAAAWHGHHWHHGHHGFGCGSFGGWGGYGGGFYGRSSFSGFGYCRGNWGFRTSVCLGGPLFGYSAGCWYSAWPGLSPLSVNVGVGSMWTGGFSTYPYPAYYTPGYYSSPLIYSPWLGANASTSTLVSPQVWNLSSQAGGTYISSGVSFGSNRDQLASRLRNLSGDTTSDGTLDDSIPLYSVKGVPPQRIVDVGQATYSSDVLASIERPAEAQTTAKVVEWSSRNAAPKSEIVTVQARALSGRLMSEGDRALQDGQFINAFLAYHKASQAAEGLSAPHVRSAVALAGSKQFDRAVREIKTAIELDLFWFESEGYGAIRNWFGAEGQAHLTRLLSQAGEWAADDLNDSDRLLLLSSLLFLDGRFADAHVLVERARKLTPDSMALAAFPTVEPAGSHADASPAAFGLVVDGASDTPPVLGEDGRTVFPIPAAPARVLDAGSVAGSGREAGGFVPPEPEPAIPRFEQPSQAVQPVSSGPEFP